MSRSADMIWAGMAALLVLGAAWASVWPLPAMEPTETLQSAVVPEDTRPEGWRDAVAQALQPRSAPTARAVAPAQPLARYELVGVVEADSGGWGLFRGNDGLITIPLGGSLDGYVLRSLTPHTAVFELGEDRVTLSRPQR
ncbi:hypothetical protein [Maricaulis maris]|uniref:Uncharacterized protein n=1 Tax=Maricaulis maris TaxID=74318 RepID=A0A495CXV8_9PROT|nr:hypothetical protein [Maricaulis maris]RKQ94136.1 hypothetical protein C7435_3108 [Maricaulis maris]